MRSPEMRGLFTLRAGSPALKEACGVALLLLVAGGASAGGWFAMPLEGGLSLPEGVYLSGEAVVHAHGGMLDLSLLAREDRAFTLTWESARGYEAGEASTGVSGQLYASAEPVNRTITTGPSSLEILECGPSCDVLLIQRPGSSLDLRGSLNHWLDWTDDHRAVAWSYNGTDQEGVELVFYQPIGAGSMPFTPTRGVDTEETAFDHGVASAEGSFLLFLDNLTAQAVGERAEPLNALDRDEPLHPTLGIAPITRHTSTYVALELVGARFVSALSDRVVVYGGDPQVELDGVLRAPRAYGAVLVEGERIVYDGEAAQITGALSIAPKVGVTSIAGQTPPSPLRDDTLEASLRGDATEVRVGSSSAAPSVRTAGKAAALPAGLLALALLILRIVWFPLYTRLDRSGVASNPTRVRIREALATDPGLTAVGLSRRLGVARAVVTHHLGMLEAHRFVVARRSSWERRYYVTEMAPNEEAFLNGAILSDDTRRSIATAVARGVATQSEIAAATGLAQRLVSYHLAKLEKAGLVQGLDGRPRRFMPTKPLLTTLADDGLRQVGAT